jgi:hypothetical protein
MSRVRSRLTYANVMATLGVFIALGGTSYAALTVTGKNVRNGSLTGADFRRGSLKTKQVKDRSLLARDFAAGQMPAGPRGDAGPPGPRGDAGPPGPNVLPSGETRSGYFYAGGNAVSNSSETEWWFPLRLPAAPQSEAVDVNGAFTAHCPFVGQAAPGYLCFYRLVRTNIFALSDAPGADSTRSFRTLAVRGAANPYEYSGVWAYTAP